MVALGSLQKVEKGAEGIMGANLEIVKDGLAVTGALALIVVPLIVGFFVMYNGAMEYDNMNEAYLDELLPEHSQLGWRDSMEILQHKDPDAWGRARLDIKSGMETNYLISGIAIMMIGPAGYALVMRLVD